MQGFATFNSQSGTGFSATVVAAAAKGLGVRVFDVHLISTTTRTNLEVRSNSASGPMYMKVQVDDVSATESTVEGTLLPNGCYIVTGANFAACSINYTTEIV